MQWRQYGRNAILIDFAENPDEWAFHKCRAICRMLETKAPPQVIEFVPGYTNVLLELDLSGEESIDNIAAAVVRDCEGAITRKPPPGPLHKIPVKYDGPDIQRVARHNKISADQLIKYHTAPIYKVYLLGFSPGFPYLGDLHHKLCTPRLDSPRLKIAAGSVAIGGKHAGIYSVDSPGGWNIIGSTKVKLFDAAKAMSGQEEGAFLLKPGDRVQFVPA